MARVSTDIEAPLSKVRSGAKLELRLWLRMLACVNLVSAELRRRLRSRFDVTLPQFDVLAQLEREPDGLKLVELSRRLMVTKGNLTGLVDTLVEAGLVAREAVPGDRRAQNIRLTRGGTDQFSRMAAAHEAWLAELLGELDRKTLVSLIDELDQVKRSFHLHARR
ncbi:MAG TPA: MarR family transcriptional regulator [Hyphomicrobiaceae bacterium]|nr:MarR family transcriptional regulator [Hyphomicrobiaceae bacterium]